VEKASYLGGTIAYVGSNLSPALVAVGYIVGLNVAILVFLGGALNWLVAIPVVAAVEGIPRGAGSAAEAAGMIWSARTRYLGVGGMVVGGLWALIKLRANLLRGVRSSVAAYRQMRSGHGDEVLRTERDAPFQWVAAAIVASVVPLFLLFEQFIDAPLISITMAVIMLVAGFLFSAVAGYMAGLVGSSNNPISGVTIATILSASLLLLLMLGHGNPAGPVAAILIGAVVCCSAAIAGDNMQDLKAGQILGATPYKQQIMQAVGVTSAAVVIAPILSLLLRAYGIGDATPEAPNALAAPQAALMASWPRASSRAAFRGAWWASAPRSRSSSSASTSGSSRRAPPSAPPCWRSRSASTSPSSCRSRSCLAGSSPIAPSASCVMPPRKRVPPANGVACSSPRASSPAKPWWASSWRSPSW